MKNLSTYRQAGKVLYTPIIVNNTDGTPETIKVPVIMMVPGVRNGSNGPMLHTAEGLSAIASQWNSIPVVIGHPQNNEGQYVAVNSTEVPKVGVISNSRWEDNKLKADVTFTASTLSTTDAVCYQLITAGQPIDISIGAFATETKQVGVYEGEAYAGVTTGYIPDHLAILPNEKGACSNEDGCGVRVNQLQTKKGDDNMELKDQVQALYKEGLGVYQLQINEESLLGKLQAIRDWAYAMDSEWVSCYLKEVYDTTFIYEKNIRRNGASIPTRFYKQDYTMNEAGEIIVESEPIQVTMKTEYTPIQANVESETETEISINKKGEESMQEPCCPQKVEELIVNAAAKFTADDRTWLLTLNSEQLDKLEPKEIQINVTDEMVVNHLATQKREAILALLPESIKSEVDAGLALHSEKRVGLLKTIQANTQAGWTEPELVEMPTAQLEKLSKSMSPGNYAGAAGAGSPQANASGIIIAPMMPAGTGAETKK